MGQPRPAWTREEVRGLHDLPLTQLVFRAQQVHRANHRPDAVQLCTLLSVKTGGCEEDCGYCSQSSHHHGAVEPERFLTVDEVVTAARKAKEAGASRFCMGAAWRSPKSGDSFERVLAMVRGVGALGMEACATLGMLTDEQARCLADAGLTSYNHNLDTSREFYGNVISTRTYDDRLATLARVARAGISVCSGGIIGMGESVDDRCRMLLTLAQLDPHPGSVPINALVPIDGTPLSGRPRVEPFEVVRMCATARLLMPRSIVRLSAGRKDLSREAQVLCFLAGANSIFYGDRLLTTGNCETDEDQRLLADAGLSPLGAVVREPGARDAAAAIT